MMIKDTFYFIATVFVCFGLYLILSNNKDILLGQNTCNDELHQINLTFEQWQLSE